MPNLLPWTRCWRNAYATAAKEHGHTCTWDSGTLCLHDKDGIYIGSEAPTSNPFDMGDFIKEVHTHNKVRLEKKAAERQDKHERVSEILSRIAAGEPFFLLHKKREQMPSNAFTYLPLMAALGTGWLGMGIGNGRRFRRR